MVDASVARLALPGEQLLTSDPAIDHGGSGRGIWGQGVRC
jgi:hypothetical protein